MENQTITALLKELEATWKKQDAPILKKLSPGSAISKNDINCCENDLPDAMIELYKWKSGIVDSFKASPAGSLKFFQMGIMLSISEICIVQRGMTEEEFGWETSRLPLFQSGGGEFFLIETDTLASAYGRIFYHSVGAVDFELVIDIYDSLYSLFMTTLQCFKMGVYKFQNGTEYLETTDVRLFYEIGKRYNPFSAYWNLYDI